MTDKQISVNGIDADVTTKTGEKGTFYVADICRPYTFTDKESGEERKGKGTTYTRKQLESLRDVVDKVLAHIDDNPIENSDDKPAEEAKAA